MLKETEETRLFVPHFYHWWHFDWGGPGPLSPPWLRLYPILHGLFDQRILRGAKMLPYLTPKPKVIRTRRGWCSPKC